jgi:hypothetical protein
MPTALVRLDAKQLTDVPITLHSRNTKNKEVSIVLRFVVPGFIVGVGWQTRLCEVSSEP